MSVNPQVVHQETWAAVKQIPAGGGDAGDTFDVWAWDLFQMRWKPVANYVCHHWTKAGAVDTAQYVSRELQAMLDNNRNSPPPLVASVCLTAATEVSPAVPGR